MLQSPIQDSCQKASLGARGVAVCRHSSLSTKVWTMYRGPKANTHNAEELSMQLKLDPHLQSSKSSNHTVHTPKPQTLQVTEHVESPTLPTDASLPSDPSAKPIALTSLFARLSGEIVAGSGADVQTKRLCVSDKKGHHWRATHTVLPDYSSDLCQDRAAEPGHKPKQTLPASQKRKHGVLAAALARSTDATGAGFVNPQPPGSGGLFLRSPGKPAKRLGVTLSTNAQLDQAVGQARSSSLCHDTGLEQVAVQQHTITRTDASNSDAKTHDECQVIRRQEKDSAAATTGSYTVEDEDNDIRVSEATDVDKNREPINGVDTKYTGRASDGNQKDRNADHVAVLSTTACAMQAHLSVCDTVTLELDGLKSPCRERAHDLHPQIDVSEDAQTRAKSSFCRVNGGDSMARATDQEEHMQTACNEDPEATLPHAVASSGDQQVLFHHRLQGSSKTDSTDPVHNSSKSNGDGDGQGQAAAEPVMDLAGVDRGASNLPGNSSSQAATIQHVNPNLQKTRLDQGHSICPVEHPKSNEWTSICDCVDVNLPGMRARRASFRNHEQASKANTAGTAGRAHDFEASSLQAQAALMLDDKDDIAAGELERKFNKQDFKTMRIHGQFNHGFIMASIGKEMFIVDQHAADEKSTFERLQDSLVMNKQPLLAPLDLGLPAVDNITIRENMDVFTQNGFGFVECVDTGSMKLISVPFSKGTSFGIDDVHEMIGMIYNGETTRIYVGDKRKSAVAVHTRIRPSKIRAMLAMRACRSSIMVGTVLNLQQMRTIVSRLAELDGPWNCPHGRPTLRHVCTIPTSA
eukprot:jgi/Ulvmu1/10580/UM065_0034.1